MVLDPDGGVDAFYEPFRRNMRDLGSPVHSRRLFEEIARAFGESARWVITRREGRSVGGLVAIDFADRVSIPWASTLREERSHCPNNQIYWEAMCWALRRKTRRIDFGRSPIDGGTQRFKKGWGAVGHPMYWLRLDPEGRPLTASHDGDSKLLQHASRLWPKLPQGLTDWLGPRLRPHLSS